ncbi:MAG: recombination mediator RecR [Bdellovibrionia bacterium]
MQTASSNHHDRHDPVAKLIFELSKLPGIGEKTAARLSYFILKQDESYARSLGEAVINAKQKTSLCNHCFTFTNMEVCKICLNQQRDHGLICVVERPTDVHSVEQSGNYRGMYHVLHGALSPLDGIGPEDLKIRELLSRLHESAIPVRELILAANPSVEGEATSIYLSRLIKPFGIRITKLAHGLPVGGLLEYTDKQTISKALENRVEIN